MAFTDLLLAYVSAYWPLIAIGVLVFAIWGAAKEGAKRAGMHLGVAGIGLVAALLAVLSWWVGAAGFALLLGLIGAVLLIVGLSGGTR